jgi:hypothetical protein
MFTNDTFQGRPKAEHVPLSDQWGDNVPKVKTPKKWRPDEYHKQNVLNDYNGKAVATEIIEDVFHSFEANPKRPNPHNCRYDNGRYYYDYPASWLNSGTVARAVSLRSIKVPAKSLFFQINFLISGLDTKIYITVPSYYTIEQALSAITKTFNKARPEHSIYKMCYAFLSDTNTARLFITDLAGTPISSETLEIIIDSADDGFFELFNVYSEFDKARIITSYNKWESSNVWDRKDICVHASFVNNSAFHFLGRDGDFFPQPSKIFYQNMTGNDFEIYLTRDGVNPLDLPFQDFAVELSFLIDRNHYQE